MLMYIDFALAGTQVALLVLKLTERFDRSWWLVMLPTIIWAVVGVIVTATGKDEQNGR